LKRLVRPIGVLDALISNISRIVVKLYFCIRLLLYGIVGEILVLLVCYCFRQLKLKKKVCYRVLLSQLL